MILYYLYNKEAVSQYIADWLEWGRKAREEQRQGPPPGVAIMKIKATQEALKKHMALLSG